MYVPKRSIATSLDHIALQRALLRLMAGAAVRVLQPPFLSTLVGLTMKKTGSVLTSALAILCLAAGAMAADAPTTGTSNEVDKTKSQSIPAAKRPPMTKITINASGTPTAIPAAKRAPIDFPVHEPPPPPPPPPPPK
jgi:hypothetical protein